MIKICFLIVVLFVNALNKYSLECAERKHIFQNKRAIALFVTPCNAKHETHTHLHTFTQTHTNICIYVYIIYNIKKAT